MRRPSTTILVRISAALFGLAVIAVTLVDMTRDGDGDRGGADPIAAMRPSDPASELAARCRAITDPADIDQACRAYWAARQAEFLGTGTE